MNVIMMMIVLSSTPFLLLVVVRVELQESGCLLGATLALPGPGLPAHTPARGLLLRRACAACQCGLCTAPQAPWRRLQGCGPVQLLPASAASEGGACVRGWRGSSRRRRSAVPSGRGNANRHLYLINAPSNEGSRRAIYIYWNCSYMLASFNGRFLLRQPTVCMQLSS